MFSNFVSDYIRLTFILASVITTALGVKDEIHVDVAKDIPNNGHWTVDCDDGYQELTSGFDCRNGVDLPDEDNYGQRGFWTDCDSTCKIKYQVQLEDITFAARVYQTYDELTSVSFDGMSWEFYKGEGWIDIVKSLDGQTVI